MAAQAFADGRYCFGPMIGAGAFGKVFMGTDLRSNRAVAVKVEAVGAVSRSLAREYKVYKMLANTQVTPEPFWLGSVGGRSLMVFELLGPSLEDLFNFCGRRFSLRTVLQLADQMLDCLDIVHGHGLVHRDLKPDNFLIGLGDKASTVFLADFGLAGCWLDGKTKSHVPRKSGKGLTGTVRYMSLNAHWGITQSRRDDLESLGYLLVFFLRGVLPWQDAKPSTRSGGKSDPFLTKKLSTSVQELCAGCPEEFAEYVTYCRALHFEEDPDYDLLRKKFHDLSLRQGHAYGNVYDWTLRISEAGGGSAGEGDSHAGAEVGAATTDSTVPSLSHGTSRAGSRSDC